jgi:hypothetical protein
MLVEMKSNSSMELHYPSHIDRIYFGTVISEQSSQWPSNNFTAVDNGNNSAVQTVPKWQYFVVDTNMFHNFNNGKWSAWNDAFTFLVFVQVSHIVIHVVSDVKT